MPCNRIVCAAWAPGFKTSAAVHADSTAQMGNDGICRTPFHSIDLSGKEAPNGVMTLVMTYVSKSALLWPMGCAILCKINASSQ